MRAPPHASYNSAITAADAAVGKLVGALQQHKIYTNTAVIVVADCGESLGAHGEDGHGIFLYDETIHVPLLDKTPGRRVIHQARRLYELQRQSEARGHRSHFA